MKIYGLEEIKKEVNLDKAQSFFTNTCMLHMDKYVPYDTGTLANTVITTDNQIIYEQEYASYPYYGITKNGKKMHINTDKHLLASSYWDERMMSAEMEDVAKEVQAFIDRGAR